MKKAVGAEAEEEEGEGEEEEAEGEESSSFAYSYASCDLSISTHGFLTLSTLSGTKMRVLKLRDIKLYNPVLQGSYCN